MAPSTRSPRAVKRFRFDIDCDERFALYTLLVKKCGFQSAFLGRLIVDVRILAKPADRKAAAASRSRSKKTAGARNR